MLNYILLCVPEEPMNLFFRCFCIGFLELGLSRSCEEIVRSVHLIVENENNTRLVMEKQFLCLYI